MRIKAVCRKHPKADVYLLDGTISFLANNEATTSESSERAVEVALDEANLYCTVDDPDNHELGFVVEEASCWHEKRYDGYCGEMQCHNYYRISDGD